MTTLELTVGRFVEHKRAVGRKYESEEAALRMLVRFAVLTDTQDGDGAAAVDGDEGRRTK